MKLLFILAFAVVLYAEDASKTPEQQIIELKQENERLLKLITSYQQLYFTCEANMISIRVLSRDANDILKKQLEKK